MLSDEMDTKHPQQSPDMRVAARLATVRMGTNWDSGFPFCPPEMTERLCPRAFNQDCHWCHLKYARLTVEQEMEAEHDR